MEFAQVKSKREKSRAQTTQKIGLFTDVLIGLFNHMFVCGYEMWPQAFFSKHTEEEHQS